MSWNSPRRTLWWERRPPRPFKRRGQQRRRTRGSLTSSENNVVSVEGEGLECTLTAKSLGSATIIATVEGGRRWPAGGHRGGHRPWGCVSIRVSQDEVTISSGETYTINATVEMEKADMTPATIKWSSNNTSVAEVDSEGVITAREVGNAIIKGVAGENRGNRRKWWRTPIPPPMTPPRMQDGSRKRDRTPQITITTAITTVTAITAATTRTTAATVAVPPAATAGPAARGMETRPTAAQGIPPPAGRAAQPMAAPPAAREPAAQTPGPDNKPCRARTGPTGPVRVL